MPLEIERIYTWNDQEVTDILRAAVNVVESAEIPDDLRDSAFQKAVQMLSHHNAIPKAGRLALPDTLLNG